ncbi:MAG: hypothetical protein AUI15_15810 [Actinobacteria bacterium 13_2_20CM_2_66_6]|nr:MAG: hypothetical protein AUI15_15810 [Actinobacteria bacterium 13_2_20CM_2_66_6]
MPAAAAQMRPGGQAEPAVEGPRVPTTEARSEQVRQAPPLREARSRTSRRELQPARWPEVPTTGRRLAIRMKLHPRPGAPPMMLRALRSPPMKARAAYRPAPRRGRPMTARAPRVPRLGLRYPTHSRTARVAHSRLEGVPRSAARGAEARRLQVPRLGAAARLLAAAVEPLREAEPGHVLGGLGGVAAPPHAGEAAPTGFPGELHEAVGEAGEAGAAGAPHDGDAGADPQVGWLPGAGGAGGWSQLGPAAGCGGAATTVEATDPGLGVVTGGAQVATAVCGAGDAAARAGAAGLTAF